MTQLSFELLFALNESNRIYREYFYFRKQFSLDDFSQSLCKQLTTMIGFRFRNEFIAFGIHKDEYKLVFGNRFEHNTTDLDLKVALKYDQSDKSFDLNAYLKAKVHSFDAAFGVRSKDK